MQYFSLGVNFAGLVCNAKVTARQMRRRRVVCSDIVELRCLVVMCECSRLLYTFSKSSMGGGSEL